MWIRSQNRKSLTDCDSFAVEKFFEQYEVVTLSSRSGISVALGIYSSEEKAFAVLDEIQGKIECPYPSKIMPAFGTICYYLTEKNKFYQMPQDEDVEV